jgi:hypothetical protein
MVSPKRFNYLVTVSHLVSVCSWRCRTHWTNITDYRSAQTTPQTAEPHQAGEDSGTSRCRGDGTSTGPV